MITLLLALSVAFAAPPPQLPQDSDVAHYTAIQFKTAEGFTIFGHLATPQKFAGPYPAVLLLVGSGTGDRYENIPGPATSDGKASLLFKPIESALLEKGIAVMTYDKRGVIPAADFITNEVDGSIMKTASANNLAADALLAFDTLKSRAEIDPSRLGVLGHSEGTILALKVAEKRGADIQALFMLGLLTRSMTDILAYQGVTNEIREFNVLDENHDGYLDQNEVETARAADAILAQGIPAWSDLTLAADLTHDGKVSEQEYRYMLEDQQRHEMQAIRNGTLPFPEKGLPREWLTQYLAEGPYFERHLKFCAKIHLFQGQIDVQTPFEDALQLDEGCRAQKTPLGSFQSYAEEGHAFSHRTGYKNVRDTVGPIDPVVPLDIAEQAAKVLLAPSVLVGN